MTMVVSCQLKEGIVLISDSRASWGNLPEDALQKILNIGYGNVLSYCGDVTTVGFLLGEIRKLQKRKRKYRYLDQLVKSLPPLIKYIFTQKVSRENRNNGLQIVLIGKNREGKLEIWGFDNPSFEANKITNKHYAIGSGSGVSAYLKENIEKIDESNPNLKKKADILMSGLTSALNKLGVTSVGGLFQILLITQKDITPLDYGFLDLNPFGLPNAKNISFENGQWIQKNLSLKKEIPLLEPTKLIKDGYKHINFNDFNTSISNQSHPKWFLNYLVASIGIKINPSTIEFLNPLVSRGAFAFPFENEFYLNLGFWGEIGDHTLDVIIDQDGKRKELNSIPIKVEFPMEDIDIQIHEKLIIQAPVLLFIECYINKQMIARRPFFYYQIDKSLNETDKDIIIESMRVELLKQTDYLIEDTKVPMLVYFSLCENVVQNNELLKFENQFFVTYWKNYPLKLRYSLAFGFRASKGKHVFRIDLVSAITHNTTKFLEGNVETQSSILITAIHSDLVSEIPESGIYYLKIFVDNQLIGISLLICETDKPQYSYEVSQEILEKVSKGELFSLVRRSYKAK